MRRPLSAICAPGCFKSTIESQVDIYTHKKLATSDWHLYNILDMIQYQYFFKGIVIQMVIIYPKGRACFRFLSEPSVAAVIILELEIFTFEHVKFKLN